jgi:heparosan-N-sulfate-glucuronate 5-epimerase
MNLLRGRLSNRGYWDQKPQRGSYFETGNISGYYFDLCQKYPYPGLVQDGIPVVQYGKGKPYANPVIVAQTGLGALELFRKTKDVSALSVARIYADWFVCNQNRDGVWIFQHDVKGYGLYGTWPSCLGQGQAISFLLRMYALSGDEPYYLSALKGAVVLQRPVAQGGTRLLLDDGSEWLEEYPGPKPSLVLNGHIYALLAFHDLWLVTKDSAWLREFEIMLASTIKALPKYDDGGWSLYDRAGRMLVHVASKVYHHRHIVQLEVLHGLSAHRDLLRFAERWRGVSLMRTIRALAQKVLYRTVYGW